MTLKNIKCSYRGILYYKHGKCNLLYQTVISHHNYYFNHTFTHARSLDNPARDHFNRVQ